MKKSLHSQIFITHSQQYVPIDVPIVFLNRLNHTYNTMLNILASNKKLIHRALKQQITTRTPLI
jgi:hypothetical protein